jgi:hypothetical protein
MYYGIVKPLSIMLGKVPSGPGTCMPHNVQGRDHSMTLRSGMTNSLSDDHISHVGNLILSVGLLCNLMVGSIGNSLM